MPECLTLKKSNCKNCYKCIRHCPVKSIRFSANQAHINSDECILCGQCFVVCPQNAKQVVDEIEKAKMLINSGYEVYASIAPSFIANYDGYGIESIRTALKKLGFTDVEETAIGATIVKTEYEKMVADNQHDIIISSCCHSINLLIQKYFTNLLPYLADVHSPMQAHSLDIKRRHKDSKVVFIGPCVAKKDEANLYGDIVDAVLTFEELSGWLSNENITIEKEKITESEGRARFFPTTGGILKTMNRDNSDFTYLAIDGVDNCISALKDIESGHIHKCFIEMSACSGSCIGGPVMEKFHRSPVRDYAAVAKYAGNKDFDVEQPDRLNVRKNFPPIRTNSNIPSDDVISEILISMGKKTKADELNCGSCGYNTCREKAIAIYQGKAEISMCLPYLKDKAESFSDAIVKNTPNALLVLNEQLEVQQINSSALRLLNLRDESIILGDQIGRVLDPSPFVKVITSERGIYGKHEYLAEYDKHVEETIVHDKENHMLIAILRDISQQMAEKAKKEELSRQTVEIADKVVEKQMRIVQEIASLLGETAAETKIALTNLKESTKDE